jgi:hypothetical protein
MRLFDMVEQGRNKGGRESRTVAEADQKPKKNKAESLVFKVSRDPYPLPGQRTSAPKI